MRPVTLNLTPDSFADALRLKYELKLATFEELFDNLVEERLWQIQRTEGEDIRAGEIDVALDSILEPMVALGELVVQPTAEQDSALIDSIPQTFQKLREMTTQDLVLTEFASQGELAQRACCMVYAKLDDTLWGTSTARRLVSSALEILSRGALAKPSEPTDNAVVQSHNPSQGESTLPKESC